ncbi:MAG: hypothetical protein ACFFDN_32425 [Candidatus Hodarchaeota archaeon]
MIQETLRNMNEKEKMVLAGLIHYPSSPDIEISQNVDIKHSTFATIKKRLALNKMFRRYYLPNFTDLGAEILSIILRDVSESNATKGISSKPLVENLTFLKEFSNILLSSIETNISLSISIDQNYSELSRFLWEFDQKAKQNRIEFDKRLDLHFPVNFSEIPRFLDFSRSITNHLGIFLPPSPFRPTFLPKNPNPNITKLGWEIYLKILKNPWSSPREIAEMINKPRTTTTRWLRNFTQSGLLTPRIIPNLKKVGYQISLASHITIVSSNRKMFSQVLKILDNELTPIILIRSDHDLFYIAPFASFESALECESKFIESMNEASLNFKTNYRYIFSFPHTHFQTTLDDSLENLVKSFGLIKN